MKTFDASPFVPRFTVVSGPGVNAVEARSPEDAARRPPPEESPIRVRRNRRGMSLRQLAAAAGIGHGYLSQIETGRRRGSAAALAAIERAFEMLSEEPARPEPSRAARSESGEERTTVA